MARLFIDGFEHGNLDLWDSILNPANVSVDSVLSGRDGNYCLRCDASNQTGVYKNLPSRSELYVALKIYPKNSARVFRFYSGTTALGYLWLSALGGQLQAKRDDATILATGTVTINVNTWYLVEVHYKPADSGGIFQVKVDGVLDIDFSGDTTPGGATVDRIAVGTDSFSFGLGYYDNIIVDDAAWIGDTRIQAIKPSAAGSSAQWDPSAGANWDCVKEVPPSDTDFNSTGAAEEIDLFTFGDLTGSIESVKCVQVQSRAKFEGNPTAQKLQLGVRQGGANYFGASKDLTTAFKQHSQIWEQDPATAAPWTPGGVNSAEFGYKAVTT
jgi:hypothetical protein